MSILILDLDLTVFVSMSDFGRVDLTTHQTGHCVVEAELISEDTRAYEDILLLNPEMLSDLIEYACEHHDGIMILTAGCWGEDSIKYILTNYLDISDNSAEKITRCHFITPANTLDHFEDKTALEIAHMPKNERLQHYIARHPELQGKHFVMVDDSLEHIDSFADNPQVTGIHATTTTFDITNFYAPDLVHDAFYEDAKMALDHPKQMALSAGNTLLTSVINEATGPVNENSPPPSPPPSDSGRKRTTPVFFREAPETPDKKPRAGSLLCEETLASLESMATSYY